MTRRQLALVLIVTGVALIVFGVEAGGWLGALALVAGGFAIGFGAFGIDVDHA